MFDQTIAWAHQTVIGVNGWRIGSVKPGTNTRRSQMGTTNRKESRKPVIDRLDRSDLVRVNGGIGTTKPMEEGVYIDGVLVYTSAWAVYAMLNSGAVSSVVVKGM